MADRTEAKPQWVGDKRVYKDPPTEVTVKGTKTTYDRGGNPKTANPRKKKKKKGGRGDGEAEVRQRKVDARNAAQRKQRAKKGDTYKEHKRDRTGGGTSPQGGEGGDRSRPPKKTPIKMKQGERRVLKHRKYKGQARMGAQAR